MEESNTASRVDAYTANKIISYLDRFTRRFVATIVSKRWNIAAKEMDDIVVRCDWCLNEGNRGIGRHYPCGPPTWRQIKRRSKKKHRRCILYSLKDFRAKLCKAGNAKLLRALHSEHADYESYPCVHNAVKYGRINVLKFFKELNVPFEMHENYDNWRMYDAAEAGSLNSLRWFTSQGACHNTKKLSRAAAWGGQIKVLQWLKDNNFEIDEDIAKHAAERGKKNVILWAMINGYRIDALEICKCAVIEENYDICGLVSVNLLTTSTYMQSKFEQHKSYGHLHELDFLLLLKVAGLAENANDVDTRYDVDDIRDMDKLVDMIDNKTVAKNKVNDCNAMFRTAVWNKDIASVEYFLECGISTTCPPLHMAGTRSKKMLRHLIKRHALIDIDKCLTSKYWAQSLDRIPYVRNYAKKHGYAFIETQANIE